MLPVNRRHFLQSCAAGLSVGTSLSLAPHLLRAANPPAETEIQFGLVTYQWGKDWELPTLIKNLTDTNVLGVELRTTHKHGVEPSLSTAERQEVRKRFEDSPVTCVGIGSNERYDDRDPAVVKKAIADTKAFIELSHDIGSTGVKVKPDRFWPEVPHEQTIAQIGKALNELGSYAEEFGQQIRLEVHGQCAELPTIAAIMEVADHPSVAVCWNSNPQDLQGEGLAHNFGLVKNRMGATAHVHVLDMPEYPFAQLFDLYVGIGYRGWWLLEEGKVPADPVAELKRQRALFDKMYADALKKVA